MALANGDYITLTGLMVAQMKLDTGDGGLWQDIGNWPVTHGGDTRRSVNTIEDEIVGDLSAYESTQYPVIIVQPFSKDAEVLTKHIHKIYNMNLMAVSRSDDPEAADTEIYKIMHRLEAFSREQNDVANIWGLNPDGSDIDGMDIGAGVVTTLGSTEIVRFAAGQGEKPVGFHTMGTLAVAIDIPAQFTYS